MIPPDDIEDTRLLTGDNDEYDYDAEYEARLTAADFYHDCLED